MFVFQHLPACLTWSSILQAWTGTQCGLGWQQYTVADVREIDQLRTHEKWTHRIENKQKCGLPEMRHEETGKDPGCIREANIVIHGWNDLWGWKVERKRGGAGENMPCHAITSGQRGLGPCRRVTLNNTAQRKTRTKQKQCLLPWRSSLFPSLVECWWPSLFQGIKPVDSKWALSHKGSPYSSAPYQCPLTHTHPHQEQISAPFMVVYGVRARPLQPLRWDHTGLLWAAVLASLWTFWLCEV